MFFCHVSQNLLREGFRSSIQYISKTKVWSEICVHNVVGICVSWSNTNIGCTRFLYSWCSAHKKYLHMFKSVRDRNARMQYSNHLFWRVQPIHCKQFHNYQQPIFEIDSSLFWMNCWLPEQRTSLRITSVLEYLYDWSWHCFASTKAFTTENMNVGIQCTTSHLEGKDNYHFPVVFFLANIKLNILVVSAWANNDIHLQISGEVCDRTILQIHQQLRLCR